jgi:cellulose synthase/poly-beta-1,6-N-acetylglucosamine synthase-like glycosyltransferase
MELVVLILRIYTIAEIFILLIYTFRHFAFTFNRVFGEQKLYYHDIVDSELDKITILVPMHNEEAVANDVMTQLTKIEYPRDKFEVIPINDHSSDSTREILDGYAAKYPFIKPLHRDTGGRGKPHGLNDAMELATGDIIIVFDADYIPSKGIVRDIAICFKDQQVGAVMGRVIPKNTDTNMLTRLLDLERSGGYQVDQQARHNMTLIPQYGGTVGGFRKDVAQWMGGFNPYLLTEDTELTFLLFLKGWKVVYANKAECYEESPEDWAVRARQISRWSRGHTQVMLKSMIPLLRTGHLNFKEKVDGVLLMLIYSIPLIMFIGIPVSLMLFFLGEMNIVDFFLIFILVAAYNSFGNFAPFYQIGTAAFIDGVTDRLKLLPLFFFGFLFNVLYISKGAASGILDIIFNRNPEWQKTTRFRKQV